MGIFRYAFERVAELRRGDRHRPDRRAGGARGRRRRPDEAAALQPLGEQARTLPVVPDDLDEISAATSEHEQVTRVRVLRQLLLHQYGERREAFALMRCTA
jgi:hypothetical protein